MVGGLEICRYEHGDQAAVVRLWDGVRVGAPLERSSPGHQRKLTVPTIFEANKPMLKDPERIYPRQVLRVPAEMA